MTAKQSPTAIRPGKVYLVGAGPGDPELLTRKALRVLQDATVVLHDDLVAPEILSLVPFGAAVFNVGKRCGRKTMTQEQIHVRMIAPARDGHTVVRLKGGDPTLYGRAGEEMLALRAAGIDFEVIPGVTAAFAAAAAAQIPLTDRRFASQVVFVTGHRCGAVGSSAGASGADGLKGVTRDSTVVVYMPGQRTAQIAEELEVAGVALTTPCAVVSAVSTSRQQIVHLTLQDLFSSRAWPAPSVLIIGEVVAQPSIRPQAENRHVAQTGCLSGLRGVLKEGPMQHELSRTSLTQEITAAQDKSQAKNDVRDLKHEQESSANAPGWRRIMWNFAEAWYG